jgi:hypothetical protein
VTYTEPELLALRLQELFERRSVLRGFLEQALTRALTQQEQADIRRVIDLVDLEMAQLEERLRALQPGAGGNG